MLSDGEFVLYDDIKRTREACCTLETRLEP